MNKRGDHHQHSGLESLLALPTVVAEEFRNWGRDDLPGPPPVAHKSPFASEREYRFCKAVVEHPLQASSQYAGLAGISPKNAQTIRVRLVSLTFIREQIVNPQRRGPNTLLLEPLAAGVNAVREYEAQLEGQS